MEVSEKISKIDDNGGMRSLAERRQYSIINYKPERRSGKERRIGVDRRKEQRLRGEKAIERRESFR